MLADILLSKHVPMDVSILKAELRADHRVRSRIFVLDYIPRNSVGAELGVFTGLFSSHLARNPNAARVTFVDPWWTLFGDRYPDWGIYTDYGRIETRAAHAAAKRRVLRHRMPNRAVEVATSSDWLAAQPDESLDWVYLDTTHSYEGTKEELDLLERKLKARGIIIGDDWQPDEGHIHHGVVVAVHEFVKRGDFRMIVCGREGQWILRRDAS